METEDDSFLYGDSAAADVEHGTEHAAQQGQQFGGSDNVQAEQSDDGDGGGGGGGDGNDGDSSSDDSVVITMRQEPLARACA